MPVELFYSVMLTSSTLPNTGLIEHSGIRIRKGNNFIHSRYDSRR
jgi:hypothetical protein